MFIPVFLALFTSSAGAEPYALNTDAAVAVHLAPAGLDRIGESIAMLAPEEILISAGSNVFDCSDDTTLVMFYNSNVNYPIAKPKKTYRLLYCITPLFTL